MYLRLDPPHHHHHSLSLEWWRCSLNLMASSSFWLPTQLCSHWTPTRSLDTWSQVPRMRLPSVYLYWEKEQCRSPTSCVSRRLWALPRHLMDDSETGAADISSMAILHQSQHFHYFLGLFSPYCLVVPGYLSCVILIYNFKNWINGAWPQIIILFCSLYLLSGTACQTWPWFPYCLIK